MKTVKDILKKPVAKITKEMDLDIHSKRIKFIDYVYSLVYAAIHNYDLTDTSMDNNIIKSWLSKLNSNRTYIPFIELFYELLYPYIKAHDYRLYGRYMRILGIDSTFIKTFIKGSGNYKGTEVKGMKIHVPSIVYPFTVPLNASISSANVNDSSLFDNIINNIDDKILYSSILVFDLGYYNLERFSELKNRNIPFVSRIKKNAIYDIVGSISGHEIIKMKNGLTLRSVRVNINGVEYIYITNMLNLPDKYICYAYNLRWNIEEFFKAMKSYLHITHLISRSINGMIVQVFSHFIAYIIINIIKESIGINISFSEIIRGIRHGNIRYFNNKYSICLSNI